MKTLLRRKKFWSERFGTIKATCHTASLKEGTRLILQQPYHAIQQSLEVLSAHTDKQREVGVVKSAQSERASPIVLVPKKNGTNSNLRGLRPPSTTSQLQIPTRCHVSMIASIA